MVYWTIHYRLRRSNWSSFTARTFQHKSCSNMNNYVLFDSYTDFCRPGTIIITDLIGIFINLTLITLTGRFFLIKDMIFTENFGIFKLSGVRWVRKWGYCPYYIHITECHRSYHVPNSFSPNRSVTPLLDKLQVSLLERPIIHC